MSYDRMRLAVIVGSSRRGRTGSVVAAWFAEQARKRGDLDVDVIELAEYPLPSEPVDRPAPETERMLGDLSPRLLGADMFVLITPEYNRSFPASLKAVIDWHVAEWQAKPVSFVSYGGRSGGLRAVEQLRQVFPELHAVTVRETVSFHEVWDAFDAEGSPTDATGCNAAAKSMLDQLGWWGRALREARDRRPYRLGRRPAHSGRRLPARTDRAG